MQLLKDWIIPLVGLLFAVVSFGLSFWFAASAKKDAERAQTILDSVNRAIEEWQRRLMESTINILDSTPQVIDGKRATAKLEAARELIVSLRVSMEAAVMNPQGGASGHTQTENLKIIAEQIDKLLKSMSEVK